MTTMNQNARDATAKGWTLGTITYCRALSAVENTDYDADPRMARTVV